MTVEAGGSILSGREKVPAGNWRQIENGLWLNGNHVQTGALRPRLFNGDGRMISVHFQTKPQDLKEGEAVWNKNGIY